MMEKLFQAKFRKQDIPKTFIFQYIILYFGNVKTTNSQ